MPQFTKIAFEVRVAGLPVLTALTGQAALEFAGATGGAIRVVPAQTVAVNEAIAA